MEAWAKRVFPQRSSGSRRIPLVLSWLRRKENQGTRRWPGPISHLEKNGGAAVTPNQRCK